VTAPRLAALFVAASLAAFMPLAAQAWQKDAFAWDTDLSRAIHAYENRDTILDRQVDPFTVVLNPAVELLGFLLVLVAIVTLDAHGRRRDAVFVALGVAGASLLGPVLKEIFDRPGIDPNGNPSFPSGHAIRSMAAAAALTVVAWPTRWRRPMAILSAIAVLVIGFAVVYHEWHWASDVLGAWLLAAAWLGCVWLVLWPSSLSR
jgi:membrane-associated phospholipid phosphatase